MCGIAGSFEFTGERVPDAAVLERMIGALSHRGPDDSGMHREPGVGLGFRRLSIVDLAGGHQPLANEDGSLHLVFNGELYNHATLRETLERDGHRYRSRSDAETVLHAYETWGPDCLERFQGMFAFALHDRQHRRLLAARDRLGIKPLHYAARPTGLVFASEIKALLAHPEVPREADPEAAALYLTYRYLPSPHTLFRGIRKLPPGHCLIADREGLRVERWWNVPLDEPFEGTPEEARERLVELLEQSVRDRLMADVPLGALLSGGLDSSIIVELMASLHGGAVKTYSVGFTGSQGNASELPFARRVAERVGADHHELVMADHDLPAYMRPLIWNMDEPLVEPAAIPVFLISRLARETVTVVLTGEGADELFAGYPKYGRDHLARPYGRLPRFLRQGLLRRGLDAAPFPLRRLRVAERSLSLSGESERWASWFAGFAGEGRGAILHPDLGARLRDAAATAPLDAWLALDGTRDPLTRMLYADVKTWLADDLLMKMDRMSMATSLEARVPFLDHRVVAFAFSLPAAWKLHRGQGKWILREAFRSRLHPDVLARPKAGFPVPIDRWFREDLRGFVGETLLSERAAGRGILNPREVRRIVDQHLSGRRDYRRELWTLLNLELWFQVFIDAPAPPLEAPALPVAAG